MIVSRSRTMHPQLPALTIGRTVLKESDDLVILGVAFDFNMIFEKLFRGFLSWGSSGKYSTINCFLGDAFGFALPVLEFCSAVWCLAAETHLKPLDREVSGSSFLTGGVSECDLAHRRSVAVICMLYKIRRNPMAPLYGALSLPYICAGAGYTRYCDRTAVHLCASSLQNLAGPPDFYCPVSISVERSWWHRIRWWGTGGFQEQGQCIFVGLAARSIFVSYCFSISLLSVYRLLLWCWGRRTNRVLIALSQPCTANLF